MPDCELTNMVMIQDPETGKVLVEKRIKKYPGIAFPGGHVEDGEMLTETDEGPVFWVDPEEMTKLQLASNMERYLPIFGGKYAECYCREENGDWNREYR